MKITEAQKNCLIVSAIFGILFWYFHLIVLVIASLIFLAGAISTTTASLLFSFWMEIGKIIGKVNSVIILTLLFYFILVPLSLLRKLVNKKQQKTKQTTNFIKRNHFFTKDDLVKPW